jgi:hypothetical protein
MAGYVSLCQVAVGEGNGGCMMVSIRERSSEYSGKVSGMNLQAVYPVGEFKSKR